MPRVSFATLWKIFKIFTVVQLFNAVMDYFMWVAYGYLVPSWTIATLSIFYIILIFAVKIAQQKEHTKQH